MACPVPTLTFLCPLECDVEFEPKLNLHVIYYILLALPPILAIDLHLIYSVLSMSTYIYINARTHV